MIYNAQVPLGSLTRMRALLVAALVFVAALAGCSGKKGDDEIHYLCSDGVEIHADDYEGAFPDNFTESQVKDFLKTKCAKAGGSGSKTNTTASAPNVLPVLKLKVTDGTGNATNVTVKGGNLTFDATGSFDPDGTLSAIAISVKDSNQTRTLPLYEAASKKFVPAFFKFDRPGIVNVSIAMVDDRAGFNTTSTKAYVNEVIGIDCCNLAVPASDAPSQFADPCKGASGTVPNGSGPLVDSNYFKGSQFAVTAGATYIVATPATDTLVTICDPTGAAVSDAKSNAAVTSNQPIVTPSGTDSYTIGFYVETPNARAKAEVVVHYEPQPAAAA